MMDIQEVSDCVEKCVVVDDQTALYCDDWIGKVCPISFVSTIYAMEIRVGVSYHLSGKITHPYLLHIHTEQNFSRNSITACY